VRSAFGWQSGAQREQSARNFKDRSALLITGTVIGSLAPALAGRALQSLLSMFPPLHPATFAATAAIMTLLPGRVLVGPRGAPSRTDPMEALRTE